MNKLESKLNFKMFAQYLSKRPYTHTSGTVLNVQNNGEWDGHYPNCLETYILAKMKNCKHIF